MSKRLLCHSIIHNKICNFGYHCTYAHSLFEQVIDQQRADAYKLLFADLTDISDSEYEKLLPLIHYCESCNRGTCTGGFNCRNGAFSEDVKICKSDFTTGSCNNPVFERTLSDYCQPHFNNNKTQGCINGIHLSLQGMLPYNKYLHIKDRKSPSQYSSVRYAYDPIMIHRLCSGKNDSSSDSSFDEELDALLADE